MLLNSDPAERKFPRSVKTLPTMLVGGELIGFIQRQRWIEKFEAVRSHPPHNTRAIFKDEAVSEIWPGWRKGPPSLAAQRVARIHFRKLLRRSP